MECPNPLTEPMNISVTITTINTKDAPILNPENMLGKAPGKTMCNIMYSPNQFETPATTWIFGDKVAIIVWSEQPIATLIRSREVSKSYRTNFDLLWNLAKR